MMDTEIKSHLKLVENAIQSTKDKMLKQELQRAMAYESSDKDRVARFERVIATFKQMPKFKETP